jgi:hypothetical protein
MRKPSKTSIVIIASVSILALCIAALAVIDWSHDYSWGARGFAVYTDGSYTTKWDSGLLEDLGANPADKTQTFYFNNTGTVPVKISVTVETLLGATANWIPAKSIILTNTGDLGNLALTLNNFDINIAGSYHFVFTASAP